MQNRKKPKAEKMPEKVFLTVGRHGCYSYGARLPLSESSILEGVYRGQELTAAYGSFDAVYSSDIPRAKATANLRAVGGDYARDKIVYIPEGAVPKDGPSAGITMATALYSAIFGVPVDGKTAMTGEITLRGEVLPIGGLKEKLLAAKMQGIKKVLIPEANESDYLQLDSDIVDGLDIHLVNKMKQVLDYALPPSRPRSATTPCA